MTVSAQFPTSTVSHGQVSETGDGRALMARNIEAMAARSGLLPATASTDFTAASAVTLTLASGCLRTLATVAIAAGITVTLQTTGAVQGQRFAICKTGTGGTGAVTIDGNAFTTHKKFNAELMFVNGSWRMIGSYEYA